MNNIEELIVQAQKGNKEAFSELISYFYKDLHKIAISKLHNSEDAFDALQECFIHAYLSIPSLKNNKYFKSWITKILINECNKIYKSKIHDKKLLDNYVESFQTNSVSSEILDFDKIKSLLNDKEFEIFSLFYEYGFTTKQISRKLAINENTIKSRLKSTRDKIKNRYKSVIASIVIVFIIMTSVVFGQNIINYLKDLFNLYDVGIDNSNILNAIEDKNWVQNVDMDYIELNENYKIKIDYMLMDDFNLYMIFDFVSSADLGKNMRFSIEDLIILDENDNIIFDDKAYFEDNLTKSRGYKNVLQEKNRIKELLFLTSGEYPTFNKLQFKFSNIVIYNTNWYSPKEYHISTDIKDFIIDINDKFIDRTRIEYEVLNKDGIKNFDFNIEKAILNDIGFYAIVKSNSLNQKFYMTDTNYKKYNCNRLLLDFNSNNEYIFLLYSNISDDIIKIDNKKYEITLIKLE